MRKQRAHDGAIRATLTGVAVLSAKRGGDQNHPRQILDYHDDAGVVRTFYVEAEIGMSDFFQDKTLALASLPDHLCSENRTSA